MSEVSICNMALASIGSSEAIVALDESSLEARMCSMLYEQARDTVLSERDWPFARRNVVLAVIDDEPVNWGFRYQYPTNALKLRGISVAGQRVRRVEQIPPYDLEAYDDETSVTIVTDVEDAVMHYTSRVTNTAIFPPLLVNAIANLLASMIAMPITKKTSVRKDAEDRYRYSLELAYSSALNELVHDQPAESAFIAGRV